MLYDVPDLAFGPKISAPLFIPVYDSRAFRQFNLNLGRIYKQIISGKVVKNPELPPRIVSG